MFTEKANFQTYYYKLYAATFYYTKVPRIYSDRT